MSRLSPLRVYDPAECDPAGVPLDWLRCRRCEGRGVHPITGRGSAGGVVGPSCGRCEGYGSLREAALHGYLRWYDGSAYDDHIIRCEGCGHPADDGVWVANAYGYEHPDKDLVIAEATRFLGRGEEPPLHRLCQHYSGCDAECRHRGPYRVEYPGVEEVSFTVGPEGAEAQYAIESAPRPVRVEATWRPVEVRTLGWAHDLRPEKLAVLCLRCHATRNYPTEEQA